MYNIASPRRTQDVDLGLRVPDWSAFDGLVDALTATGRFQKTRSPHRLTFEQTVRLDVVPFGPIAIDDQIRWPPDFDVEMGVFGFSEACAAAQTVRLRHEPELEVSVASPAGLAVMKVIAWNDRGRRQRDKDAEDLAFLARHYLRIEGIDRIARDYPEWLEGDFDYELASARLLGIDMAMVMNTGAFDPVLNVIKTNVEKGPTAPLVLEMMGRTITGEAVAREQGLLGALYEGLVQR